MNRVVFLFLSILLIGFPLNIDNFDNENVNYFELAKNITSELIHTVVKAQVKKPPEPPSPITVAIMGTFNLNISRKFTAIASP